ncbi:hypothetical protein BOTBODRAFT_163976 [Botryobasidium botryosum FD-172 SS1]|uniref:glutathione transferase n=1 Tax=Botryobasidium botryosum (strain FD-172 SS1) TaxID=930990 RepID=A0A067M6U6_BOTB1|nr:hypothetical protein BOTBODRAFT_163976 [Botryobasidium botryosum FD-172 SS1]
MAEENSPIVSPSAQPVEAELQAVGADIQPTVEEPPVTDIADAQPAAEAPVIREAQPTAEAAAQPISKAEPAAAVSAPSESTLVVHHLNNSRSQRILWLLEELEIPYSIKKYERTPTMVAPKELKDVHPLGKSPVITDGDLTIAESGAIVEYIIAKYAKGRCQPPDSGFVDNLYFSHYAEGTIMPVLFNKLIFTLIPARAPFLIRPVARVICAGVTKTLVEPQLRTNGEMIEKHLEKTNGGWFAGGDVPTAADFMMLFPMEAIVKRAPDCLGEKSKAYVEMIHARPAYKRALEKGGRYEFA